MDIRTAIIKSMKAYYEGKSPQELKAVSQKGIKYTKKYFDKVGEENGVKPYEFKKGTK
jgi:uncharacterized protein YpuA (DUF1002 family)